jgi:polyphosphate kinase
MPEKGIPAKTRAKRRAALRSKKKHDRALLHSLSIELVKLQKHAIAHDTRTLVIFEGRDGAGKDGTIKRIVEHLSPRETRVVALGKPSDRESASWYFQRWVPHLPAGGDLVLFNRSWYNRAGVERVMGFATKAEVRAFLNHVGEFERILTESGIRIFKYYLDISRDEQRKRLEARRKDPLKQWKISPIDAVALEHWDDYSRARNEMLAKTHTRHAPWTIVRANRKKRARIAVIRDLLARSDYAGKDEQLLVQHGDALVRVGRKLLARGLCYP